MNGLIQGDSRLKFPVCSSTQQLVETFNAFFLEKVAKIQNTVPDAGHSQRLTSFTVTCVCSLDRFLPPSQKELTDSIRIEDAKEILQLESDPGECAPRQPGQCAASLTRRCAVLSAIRHLPCSTQDCIGHATSQEAWPGYRSAEALQTTFQPRFCREDHREGGGCPPHQ